MVDRFFQDVDFPLHDRDVPPDPNHHARYPDDTSPTSPKEPCTPCENNPAALVIADGRAPGIPPKGAKTLTAPLSWDRNAKPGRSPHSRARGRAAAPDKAVKHPFMMGIFDQI